MVTAHQHVFKALGADVPAVLLDTPYGFQENADELTQRVQTYFADSVGRRVNPIRFRSLEESTEKPAAHADAMAQLLAARWIFAGPGSPSYALRTWAGSVVPAALDERLAPHGEGGAVVFASAAALTLGAFTVPVYEVYKVGEQPRWLEGLDVFGHATGLKAAVVPHFDNTEGGTHDTRFCYLGERRLRLLEQQLPEEAFVLGIDEHTGLVMDLDAEQCRVVGRGGVTVRRGASAHVTPAGATLSLADLAEQAGQVPREPDGDASFTPAVTPAAAAPSAALVDSALTRADVPGAVDLILTMDANAETAPERAEVRAAVSRLGAYAADAPVDRAREVGPFVDALLALREQARSDRRFDDADRVRDSLEQLGVEVRDAASGPEWTLRP